MRFRKDGIDSIARAKAARDILDAQLGAKARLACIAEATVVHPGHRADRREILNHTGSSLARLGSAKGEA
jgi:hypothetical protein